MSINIDFRNWPPGESRYLPNGVEIEKVDSVYGHHFMAYAPPNHIFSANGIHCANVGYDAKSVREGVEQSGTYKIEPCTCGECDP